MGAQCKEFKDTERETSMHAKMVESSSISFRKVAKKHLEDFATFG